MALHVITYGKHTVETDVDSLANALRKSIEAKERGETTAVRSNQIVESQWEKAKLKRRKRDGS